MSYTSNPNLKAFHLIHSQYLCSQHCCYQLSLMLSRTSLVLRYMHCRSIYVCYLLLFLVLQLINLYKAYRSWETLFAKKPQLISPTFVFSHISHMSRRCWDKACRSFRSVLVFWTNLDESRVSRLTAGQFLQPRIDLQPPLI